MPVNNPDSGVGWGLVRLGKSGQRASLMLKLCPVWQLHPWTPVPANIPFPTPYPLDNWLSPGQLCHTRTHPHTPVSKATKHVKQIPSFWKLPTCFLWMYYNAQECILWVLCLHTTCTVCICDFNGSTLVILSSGCVFGSKLKCCWSLSIIYNPVNSERVTATETPLQLCQAQFGSALAVQDSSCSQVESDYRHWGSRKWEVRPLTPSL